MDSRQRVITKNDTYFLTAGLSDSKIAFFLNVTRLFVFKFRREHDAAGGDVANVSYRKRHCLHLDIMRRPEFLSSVQVAIDEDSGKSFSALNRELHVDGATIGCVIYEDLRYKS